MSYLGIDFGTSGLRALLVDEDGAPLASAEKHYAARHPHPGWSEQDPADWIAAIDAALDDLARKTPDFADVRGIGVSGHMHGAVLLDAQGKVLRPCILWNDTRSSAQAARLDGLEGMRETSGNIVFPGFTAPKLEWVRTHEPELFDRTAKVLLPAAYVNFYLTGHYVADMSDASGTSWLDVQARDWSDELLTMGGMRRDQMPDLAEGTEPVGQLREALAQRWGLSGKVVVAAGAGDNAAAACGIGAIAEGQGFVSLGTSGVLLGAREGCHPRPDAGLHTFCHAVPGRWVQAGVTLSATDSVNWLSRITGQSPAQMTGALGDVLRPPGQPCFLPYLSGERTPHNDAHIRASLTGLSMATGPEELTQAVLEGVAFSLRDALQSLKAAGAGFETLFAIGGGAASHYWLALIATVLDIPLAKPEGGEFGAALGAARLGQSAASGGDPLALMTPPKIGQIFAPERSLTAAFDTAYEKYRATYPAIKSVQ
ncbi:xylulokinase [Actibacterium atlanticum]|uniref:Xylulose kinase n=1 Tax=Actibacterium atlanticum TaxID=1461693 RepID=A0A058ZM74_9RHOB|nr:xylulokinase [Actibacterium atlanticum]KCV81916.1 xylulokinase [Actibacterium atlanticum]